MQVKLLRAIQEKSIRPVGVQAEIKVDVRVLSATHKNLHELVASGHFRQDLYYRLNVIELPMPSLRERVEDIALLAGQFCARLAAGLGMQPPRLTDETMKLLRHYPFPGNVRELENILERALTLCNGQEITPQDLQLRAGESGEITGKQRFPARCRWMTISNASSERRSKRRWRKPARTRPPPPSCSVSASGRCVTSWKNSASNSCIEKTECRRAHPANVRNGL